jgi:hypothetical protein
MKKFVALAAAMSLAAASNVVLPTTASADTGFGPTISQACQVYFDAFLGVSQGNCVQLLDGAVGEGGTTNANAICHYWQGPQGAAFFGRPYPFASFGQCTSFFNALFGHS